MLTHTRVQSFFSRILGPRKKEACPPEYDIAGYKRIYLVHVRKTGGTSLNHMFLSLDGNDSQEVYQDLAAQKRVQRHDKIFVGWSIKQINEGQYFYAFSHTPLHQLKLPPGTFTFTCFRDPVKRVLSHYNMLMEFVDNQIAHPCLKTEGPWLGSSFDDFLNRIPPERLLAQIHMFSPKLHVPQATESVLQLQHYFFTEQFDQGVEELNRKTGLDLKPLHVRKTLSPKEISVASLNRLREKLQKEYEFLGVLKK